MGEEEERPLRAGAVQPRDEVALSRIGAEHLHVGGGEAGGLQPRRHRVGRLRHVAVRRIGGVDLDELFEDLSGARIVVVRTARRARAGTGTRSCGG